MPTRAKDSATDRLFGALANPTRRDILDLLLDGELSAGDIAARFAMSRPSVSEHLRALRDAGLVVERTAGRQVFYALAPEPWTELRDWLAPHERFWRGRMRRLHATLDALADDASPDASDLPSETLETDKP
ncbi:ArsR/SmtB family transcription factor [Leifsonia shinshuensis]|uniref:Winged helix-turn-helix transcriptional regulator n=1 Tax=Leifsonia shinshuensis TaxID=150026 RepID=A0A7G6YB21_9MICO|nr:metalloregulator ArsR/SmtB family transcription factor [Leifsonia shinshuensis]QNE35686.1 winged helix-turn-helix transcriptional regulator [Leifsonia shinshuensis]